MKKITAAAVVVILLAVLSGCGKSNRDAFVDALAISGVNDKYNEADFELSFKDLDIDSESDDVATDMTVSAIASEIEDMKLSGSYLKDDKDKTEAYDLELEAVGEEVPLKFIQTEDAVYFKGDAAAQLIDLYSSVSGSEDLYDTESIADSLDGEYIKMDMKDLAGLSEDVESLATSKSKKENDKDQRSLLLDFTQTLDKKSFKKDGDVLSHTYTKKEIKSLMDYAEDNGSDEVKDSLEDSDIGQNEYWDKLDKFNVKVEVNAKTGKTQYQFDVAYKDKDVSLDTSFVITVKPDQSDDKVKLPDKDDVITLSDLEELFASGDYSDYGDYDDYYSDDYDDDYDEDAAYEDIDEVPGWSQDIYDSVVPATENYDENTDKSTYTDGTKYADLEAKVGKPTSTTSYTDESGMTTVYADWDSPDSSDAFLEIEVSYDKTTGQIIDIECY